MKPSRIDILGVPVEVLTMSSLLGRIRELIHTGHCAAAYGLNAHSLRLAAADPSFLDELCRCDIVYADGASILLTARMLRASLPEKLTTTDIWPEACRLAATEGYSFFLLGGEPGLADAAGRKTLEKYPGLRIVGTHHGYFDFEDDRIVSVINAVRPDILWVGMGDPRQVLWTNAVRGKLEAGIIVTCGGMFKLLSGELKRAPASCHRYGFEWLYRITREPSLWRRYAEDLPSLAWRILEARLRNRTGC